MTPVRASWVASTCGAAGGGVPPFTDAAESSRPYFRRLRELAEEHGLWELSMGTSQDYRVAVEEGATYIRVGSTLFT